MVRVVTAIVFCALFSGAAAAEESAQQRPCKADMEKYCADARGDHAKMRDCMKTHFSDFSSACQARIKERQESHRNNGGAEANSGGSTMQAAPQN